MTLYAGIDGGQTATVAAIGDGVRVLARGSAGPADEIGEGAGSTRLRDALEGALADALRAAHLPPDTRFDAVVAGVSGYEGRIYGAAPRIPAERFELMHDAPIAHAGAFRGEPGAIVIAGTGCVAYTVTRAGEKKTTGGWGYLFGDLGSAFWIARTWVTIATEDEAYAAPLLRYFGAQDMRALVRSFYAGEISRERLASFAAVAIDSGEPFLDAAAAFLALLAQSAMLERPAKVAFTGGLMRNAPFKENVYAQLRAYEPSAAIVEPAADPAEGALILARGR
ncbi:MAG TPA: BadF/BadG/BcrA/BcrD ATPase family protein [Candidatus Acidoferrales bacterium]|nr:BadF/BadG/BcrA/BcrD ATPase family protein [Candidatus Acidoferrales bacterium]